MKIWKWLKLLSSVPFIKKILVNHVYIRISTSWLTSTVLQRMKTNFKISQFSRFLLMSGFAIWVKIWQWLKLLNSFPFIKKTLVNLLYIWIWSFWLTFTALQWMKTNYKISQFSRFLLRSIHVILVKIWKLLKHLSYVKFIKKTLVNHIYIRIWSSWLTFTDLQFNEDKLQIQSIFKISAEVRECDFWSKLEND